VSLPADTTVVVATMAGLPAGDYVLTAKTTVAQNEPRGGSEGVAEFTRCTLNGSPTVNTATDDYAETEIGQGAPQEVGTATLQASVTLTLPATTSVTFQCRYNNNTSSARGVVAQETKIVAIQVGTVTRTAVSG